MNWIVDRFHVFIVIALNLVETSDLTKTLNAKDVSISVIFVGDINFGDYVKRYVRQGYTKYNDTMENVAEIIREADIAVGNLESPFVTKSMLKDKTKGKFRMEADSSSVSALQFAGFDIMTLANNHLNDYGEKPINFTRDVLRKAGIKSFGFNYGPYDSPQQYIILKKKGIKIGFLGYCYLYTGGCSAVRKMYKAGPAIYRDHIAQRDVRQLKREGVDVVTVYMHWGREFFLRPHESQTRVAKYLRSIGVSAVIGAHPHVLQGHIITHNYLVAYSIGNFLFPRYGTKMTPTAASRILRMQITRKGVQGASYIPLTIMFDPITKILQPVVNSGANWTDMCSTKDKACLL